VPDLPMSAALAGGMLVVLSGRGRVLAGALLGGAVLVKGLAPLPLFLPVLWFWRKRARDLLVLLAVAFAVAAPWYLLMTWRNGWPFLEDFFWKQHFLRYLTGALQHQRPLWFYVPVLLAGFFPWSPLFVLLFGQRMYTDARIRFLLVWFVWGFLFFSLGVNKLPGYMLPMLPAVAALVGVAVEEAKQPTVILASLLASCAVSLAPVPAIERVLPQALIAGLSRTDVRFAPSVWMAPVLLITFTSGYLAWKGHRACAVAAIALLTTIAVVRVISEVYPALDRDASARVRWRSSADSIICISNANRSLRYGLSYYTGRSLPDCN
jgi:4-amino-4-deoxy-L-arabinose transferase-like glycosyltransferase